MPLSPHKFREIVFQLLYSADFGGYSAQDSSELIMAQLCVTKKALREALEIKKGIDEACERIDLLVKTHCKSYDFERIPKVERNILRLAIFEMGIARSISHQIAIAEAIRLTRKFATPEAANFINAVLDAVYHGEIEPKEGASDYEAEPSASFVSAE